MQAVFVELPAFDRHRAEYLTDEQFSRLQAMLMSLPEVGDVIPDSGGLRKILLADQRRGKGASAAVDDLTRAQRQLLKRLLKAELEQRA